MHDIRRSAVLAALLVLAVPGQAQSPANPQEVRVASGQEVQLALLNNTSGECTGVPVPELRIQVAPRSGIIIVRAGQVKFPDTAPRCAGREVPGLAVFYRSQVDFSGTDRLRIEAGATGQPTAQGATYNVTVSP